MRLTLRTLIAWLDDTLTPNEVKAIGQQVSESPSVKELIERIHRVTRQRRLTVPGESGPEATDPSLVAAYLDNQLAEDQVVDLEKRCLTSDVHLAEIASVHQILSMIGHKAKVPPEARNRMYRLVRGREASPRPRPRAERPAAAVAAPDSPSHPAVRWTNPAATRPRVLERFGPLAVVAALIGILSYLAVRSLPTTPDAAPPDQVAATPPAPAVAPRPADQPPAPDPVVAAAPPAAPVTPEPPPAAKPEPAPTELATGVVGAIEAIQGMVLRSPLDATTWEAVVAQAPIRAQTRLINLAPFRNLVRTAAGEVTLIDSAEVVFGPAARDEAAELELRRGRLVVRGTAGTPLPYDIRFEGHVLAVIPGPGGLVGLERVAAFSPGTAEPAPPRVRVFVPEGKATLRSGDSERTVDGPAVTTLQVSGKFEDSESREIPAWVADSAPSAFDKQVADDFARYLRPGRPILSDLVEAMDDAQPKVKEFAATGLGTLGDMESVAVGLDRRDVPAFHRAVVDVLRTNLAQGGDNARAVRDALSRQFDERWSKVAEQLIIGLPPAVKADEAILAGLVEDLGTGPSRGIRALALDNLRALTGRDSLEYDPDSPETGKGLRAWQDLARRKELTKGTTPAPR